MGSEMCIRDRTHFRFAEGFDPYVAAGKEIQFYHSSTHDDRAQICLLYTSDAADERSSVDLGGRRIIKKKINIAAQLRSRTH